MARAANRFARAAAAAFAAAACLPLAAFAQRGDVPTFEEAPLPPRIDDVTPTERARANDPPAADNPNRARLAPLPEERAGPVDEVVVTGEQWRQLPDLGSEWRAQREAELERRRYVFSLFRRDDRPATPLREAPFLVNPDGLPSAELDIFRIRFGRRDRDADTAEEP